MSIDATTLRRPRSQLAYRFLTRNDSNATSSARRSATLTLPPSFGTLALGISRSGLRHGITAAKSRPE